ncbi:universal stress protein [Pueribacillus theae]|uniref:Universal stress protein n=1 Tax=Pueribacillus theae TaxID=2171751 RepID=A0A2U1JTI4_9BACI|nr:universal stress protein [Pueribacillus theae]PWA08527.1 universal stress protein [Pueribacillus theae]
MLYSRILVAYDGSNLSKKALNTATELLKESSNIELDVVTVFEMPRGYESFGIYNENLLAGYRREAEKMMEDVEKELKAKNLPNKISTYILEGNTPKMLIEFANNHDSDLIIIGNRGLSGFKEVFLGSVSHYVVQRANCPVFVIK